MLLVGAGGRSSAVAASVNCGAGCRAGIPPAIIDEADIEWHGQLIQERGLLAGPQS